MFKIDINDEGLGMKNVTSRFRVDPSKKTVIAFPRRLSYSSHIALVKTGACIPLYVVPAENFVEGKRYSMGIAIPTPDPEYLIRSVYYLLDAPHQFCGVGVEEEDKRSIAQYKVVTDLPLVKPLKERENREAGIHYIYEGDYQLMSRFLN